MGVWRVRAIRALAIANGIFVLGGLYLLVDAIERNYEFGRLAPPEPYYAQVFYARSLLNLGFLVGLAVASVGIWRLMPSGRRLCNAVLVGGVLYVVSMSVFEVTTAFCGGTLELLGRALAASGGTGNMGIAPQVVTGYPVIALVILNLAFPASEGSAVPAGGLVSKSRNLAHGGGVLLGVIVGIFYFGTGTRMVLLGGAKGWFEITLWLLIVLALLSFLPVSIIGFFRPRAAAYGITAAFALLLAANIGAIGWGWAKADWSLHSVIQTFLLQILPPCAVVALLFHASAPGTPLSPSMKGAAGSTGIINSEG
ncbi:MAG TPA: hypothetical protein VGW37_02695 [Terriglobia bacterium]|nr:hypothetical protein [Terriglobia bacterium]